MAEQHTSTLPARAAGGTEARQQRRARGRLAALWLSLVARAATDAGLRLYAVLLAAGGPAAQRESAWYLVTGLFMLPCLLLAPVNGALCNSLPKRTLLAASAAFMLLALLGLGAAGSGPGLLGVVTLVALGSAVYGPTRFALLVPAAHDSGWPLTRVTAAVEAGAVLAMVAGMVAVGLLMTAGGSGAGAGPAQARQALWLASALCLLGALPARFDADRPRPEAPRAALRGFIADARRIVANPPARTALVGIALLRGTVAVAVGALIAVVLARPAGDGAAAFRLLLTVALLAMAGTGAGSALAGMATAPAAARPLVALGACGMAAALGWAAWCAARAELPLWLCAAVGLGGGLVNIPLLVRYQQALPDDARGNGMALLNTAGHLAMVLLSGLMAGLAAARWLEATGQLVAAAVLAAAGAGLALRVPAPGNTARAGRAAA